MFTVSSTQNPRRLASNHHQRGTPYGNKVKPGRGMSRSGSILGTIKNIVAVPLSWFSGGERFEDLGKRRRENERDVASDDEERLGQKTKRMRMDSPSRAQATEPTAGYLDPPVSSLPSITASARTRTDDALRKSAFEDNFNRSSSAFGGQSLTRTMSIDPPSQYVTYNPDPSVVPLPMDSPMESRFSMSAGPRDFSMRPSASPLRLRTSLTPQPSPAKPIRREASAPPPLSTLMSKPIFVKPPPSESSQRELREQKTVSLGSLAEYSRFTRSPSRDRMLTSLSSIPSVPSSLSTSTSFNARFQSPAEKAFHELEMYKTPIIPSRYKGSKAIPEFLKQPKRAHVPIPMSRKEREAKPSLGMASKFKSKGKEKAEAKPYAGESRISKLLTKRQAEVEKRPSKLRVVEDGEVEETSGKKDVGVYAKLTSESETESSRKKTFGVQDPFDKQMETTQGGKRQPYGRVGRARREVIARSMQDTRHTKSFKFSATFEDDDEDTTMGDEDVTGKETKEAPKKPVFEAPAGFTFANNVTTLQLDLAGAKEPPISSLPFSLTKLIEPTKPSPSPSATEATPKVKGEMKAPAVPSFIRAEKTVIEQPREISQPPKLAIVPPTPEQPATTKESAAAPKPFFTIPPSTVSGTSSDAATTKPPSAPSGMPNFFANSALLANANNNKSQATFSTTSAATSISAPPEPALSSVSPVPSSVVPVKDPDNPLWTGDGRSAGTRESKSPALTPAPDRPRSTSPKPLPFGGLNKPSQAPKPVESPVPSPFSFGAPPKQSEAPAPASTLLFGVAPTPPTALSTLAPLSARTTTPAPPSTQPKSPFLSVAAQANEQKSTTAEAEKKPTAPPSLFTFGAPTTNTAPSAYAGGSADAPKPLFGFGSTTFPSTQSAQPTAENKLSPFTFGASISTSPSSADTEVPKSAFGTGAGLSFAFGAISTTPAPPAAEAGKSSPFAVGATPATPPSGAERKNSFPSFGAASSSSSGFTFGTPAKPSEPATASSPFAFTAPAAARPITPPNNGDDNGMKMEESPTREPHMIMNGVDKPAGTKPTGGITFGSGPTPANPLASGGGSTSSSAMFTFGAPSSSPSTTANPFAPKTDAANPFASKTDERASSPFTFNRVASAPVISTSFSFGQKPDSGTPPATAFGAPANPFGQPTSATATTSPFTFGAPSTTGTVSNPFASSTQTTTSTPGSPFLQNSATFTFGAPSSGSNPFAFGGTTSQPASPAGSVSGLPASPATTNATFTFGQTNGSSSGGGPLFNIGAPPPPTAGTPGRPVKKLPRRGATVKR